MSPTPLDGHAMPSNFVHQYIWRDYSLPARIGWVMTLSDNEAIAFLAFVTVLVGYTQSRTWHILRYVFARLTAPGIQLPVEDKRVSQGEAIGRLLVALGRRNQAERAELGPKISPWIGVIATINMLLFVTLGILLPWTLSRGLETPVVRSGNTNTCIGYEDRPEAFANNAQLADSLFKQCWYNRSTDANPCGRMDGVFNERPALDISRQQPCPFHGNVCQDSAITLEHKHMPLRTFGVNSKSRVLLSHRLTCAPLQVQNFLVNISGSTFVFFCDPRYLTTAYDVDVASDHGTKLFTYNGPNVYSSERSGKKAALRNTPYQLDIWPSSRSNVTENRERVHPTLRRADGTVFVVGFRPGRSYYEYQIEDPIFSAHDFDDSQDIWMPDYEITALGCLEQYQFCLKEDIMRCTNWGSEGEERLAIFSYLLDKGDKDSAYDLALIHNNIVVSATVQRYLLARRGTQALISSQYRMKELFRYIDPKEQWILEVKAWYETAFLQVRHEFFQLLQRDRPLTEFPEEIAALKKMFGEVCNRMVFFDGGYTNLDLIQLMVVMSCLLLLCLISLHNKIGAGGSRLVKFLSPKLTGAFSWAKKIRFPKVKFCLPNRQRPRPPLTGTYPRNPFREQRLDPSLEAYRLNDFGPAQFLPFDAAVLRPNQCTPSPSGCQSTGRQT